MEALKYLNFQTIHSPNFPNNYDNGLDCYWNVAVDPSVEVYLTFDENFAIESETAGNQCYDFVSKKGINKYFG